MIGGIRKMPMVKNVERKIWDVERFEVIMRSSDGKDLKGNKKDMPQYPFSRKASVDMTISEWRQNRFYPNYPGLEVDVLDAFGLAVVGHTKLKNVRKSYEE